MSNVLIVIALLIISYSSYSGGYILTLGINSNYSQLPLNLAVTSSLSITFSHHIYSMPMYFQIGSDYPTLLCSLVHHMWIGGPLIMGGGTHASIYMIGNLVINNYAVLNHRHLVIGHIIYLATASGIHSFSLYIHNDTLQAFGRREYIFSDDPTRVKPFSAIWMQIHTIASFDIKMLGKKVIRTTQQLRTADFILHHIHTFTIHVAVLILLKAILYAKNSRLVSDKLELGFRYPCDGPGRGGTCQISPYDHIFLAIFWMYNCLSVILFHFLWKIQSDVWGLLLLSWVGKIQHIVSDFSVNSVTINGWLRNFLWSQAAQVIQSYGTVLSSYSLIFIFSHFIWAFSLMFLYSGRGYWQELIESVVWAHNKLKVAPAIQPRALSITQGRAVGLAHYLLGGIGTTWAFFLARIISVS